MALVKTSTSTVTFWASFRLLSLMKLDPFFGLVATGGAHKLFGIHLQLGATFWSGFRIEAIASFLLSST